MYASETLPVPTLLGQVPCSLSCVITDYLLPILQPSTIIPLLAIVSQHSKTSQKFLLFTPYSSFPSLNHCLHATLWGFGGSSWGEGMFVFCFVIFLIHFPIAVWFGVQFAGVPFYDILGQTQSPGSQ